MLKFRDAPLIFFFFSFFKGGTAFCVSCKPCLRQQNEELGLVTRVDLFSHKTGRWSRGRKVVTVKVPFNTKFLRVGEDFYIFHSTCEWKLGIKTSYILERIHASDGREQSAMEKLLCFLYGLLSKTKASMFHLIY